MTARGAPCLALPEPPSQNQPVVTHNYIPLPGLAQLSPRRPRAAPAAKPCLYLRTHKESIGRASLTVSTIAKLIMPHRCVCTRGSIRRVWRLARNRRRAPAITPPPVSAARPIHEPAKLRAAAWWLVLAGHPLGAYYLGFG